MGKINLQVTNIITLISLTYGIVFANKR